MSSLEPTPVSPETTKGLPDAPLEEGVSGLPELSAHIAILSRKRPPAKSQVKEPTERTRP